MYMRKHRVSWKLQIEVAISWEKNNISHCESEHNSTSYESPLQEWKAFTITNRLPIIDHMGAFSS